jgi:hypothetical protein
MSKRVSDLCVVFSTLYSPATHHTILHLLAKRLVFMDEVLYTNVRKRFGVFRICPLSQPLLLPRVLTRLS